MGVSRYYTVGAVTPDLASLKALDERLESSGVAGDSLLVLTRRRNERVIGVTLPEARLQRVESGMTRMQWFEFSSMFIGVTATAVLLGAFHLWTGLTVEALLVICSVFGIALYYHQPRLERKLLYMGMPEKPVEEWEKRFPHGFALALATVPGELAEDVEVAFTEDENLESPQAVDRRPIL